ncbi:MAG: Lipopolysaccharide kinase (Kdo/WaaP) family [Candidatus Parcubacteria bacterium]|jgi:tRNA A-37 threonylcarbamoyl transferase component Bud32
MESFESKAIEVNLETAAERKLDEILDNPDNAFLSEHKMNLDRIENADTSVESLRIAEELISARLEQTFKIRMLSEVEGIEEIEVNIGGIKERINNIKTTQELIGEGGDAFVVIDKNEITTLSSDACYKFAKEKKNEDGRNTSLREAEIQQHFYKVAQEHDNLCIGVPEPYYSVKYGQTELIVMERLSAKSVKDIAEGKGSVPQRLDVNKLCDDLKEMLEIFHANSLYHRDLHTGNFMISQSEVDDGNKLGFVIDFGHSDFSIINEDPYRKNIADKVFTYKKDDVIVEDLRQSLLEYQKRGIIV